MIFRTIFPDCSLTLFFLRFAAGIADNHVHDKTTNHDSRRCGLPGDWVLSRAVDADDVSARRKPMIDSVPSFRYDGNVAFTVLHN